MKAVVKNVVCGLLAFAVHAQAFAASPQALKAELQSLVNNNAAARNYMKNLGINLEKGATPADIEAALAKASNENRAKALGAVQTYMENAVSGNSAQAIQKNKTATQLAFANDNGNGIQQIVAAAGNDNAAPAAKAAAGSCTYNLSDSISAFVLPGGPSYATVEAFVKEGYLTRGKCNEDPAKMEEPNRRVFAKWGECLLNKGDKSGASDGDCLNQANDGRLSKAESDYRAGKIANDCGWNAPQYRQAAAGR